MIPVSLIAGTANTLFKGLTGLFQNKKANKINPINPVYNISPYAKDNLGLARQYLNARLPGAANAEQNILASQANTMASVNRNATDASQALAMAAAGQGQADQSFANLSAQEAQNSQGMLGNYMNANNAMTGELDKQYQDRIRTFQDQVQQKNALMGAAWQNIGNAVNDATNLATLYGGSILNRRKVPKYQPQVMTGNTFIDTSRVGPPVMNPLWLKKLQAG